MSVEGQPPPWLQEQFAQHQKIQQELQAILVQKQQMEMEEKSIEGAIEELEKSAEGDAVYKHAGSIMVKSTKAKMLEELGETRELLKTRITVMEKQRAKLEENLKEHAAKIDEKLKGRAAAGQQ